MPRLPEIDEKRLTPQQQRIHDEVKRLRGQVRGPICDLAAQSRTRRVHAQAPGSVRLESKPRTTTGSVNDPCFCPSRRPRSLPGSFTRRTRSKKAFQPTSSKRSESAVRRTLGAKTSAWFMISRWSSTSLAHCPRQATTVAWPYWESKRWSNSSPQWVSTLWWP
jgi:hypothetical protein